LIEVRSDVDKKIEAAQPFIISENNALVFIGHVKTYPAFKDWENPGKILISKEKGKLHLFETHLLNMESMYLNNTGIFYKGENAIIFQTYLGDIKEYKIDGQLQFITASNDGSLIIYNLFGGNMIFINSITGKIIDTKIDGIFPYLIDSTLFFSKYCNPKVSSDVSLDIYKTNLTNFSEPIIVLKNIFGDPWIISPFGKHIACQVNDSELNLKHVIYNIETSKFDFIDLEEKFYIPYYSYKEKGIVYYNPTNFNYKIIKVE